VPLSFGASALAVTIPYPHIRPELFRIGPFALRWYGIMYLIGYMIGIVIAKRRVRRGLIPVSETAIDSLVIYLLAGMLIGARLIYVLVYDFAAYKKHPLAAFAIWEGGLSFHGAVIGMGIACIIFARRYHAPFWTVADTFALGGTQGLFFGRLGNFINGELYGRPTNVPWAMVFPSDRLHLPRHPSQLYEAFGEGLLVFGFLWLLERRALKGGWYRPGLLGGSFLIAYGVVRFLIEFTRQPDPQLGLVLGPFSMGQLLCAIMIVAGAVMLAVIYRKPASHPPIAERAGGALGSV
jgi:phosphatidylglycerol---prolipoprotein diacylglyceryl transferase